MKAPFVARKSHKWLALVVGIQAAFWMLSGAYMAAVDIDYIHGDPLVRNTDEAVDSNLSGLYRIGNIFERYPRATAIDLVARRGRPHYVVTTERNGVLLDAMSGEVRSPIGKDEAVLLAQHYYAGTGEVAEAALLTDETSRPSEIQSRPLPLWRVRFDDRIETTFYVSPSSGELVTRRHTFWRLYDLLWMFHIMDYENRADINNNLLRVAALIGLIFALSGGWLLVYSLKRRKDSEALHSNRDLHDDHDLVPKTP